MNTFIKTFLVCLIITLGFLFYQFFGKDAYSKKVDKVNNDLFTIEKEEKYLPPKQEKVEETQVIQEPEKNKNEDKLYTCFFYTSQGTLTPVVRSVKGDNALENSILILLKGPLVSESKKGIYTEIPPNVNLLGITRNKKSVIINLSSNFANGGGITSVENRVKQLSTTVKQVEKGKDVYLYIEGKQVEYLSGDGVYIKQPLD